MADENKAVSFGAGSGQIQKPAANGGEAKPEGSEPKYITMQELQALEQKLTGLFDSAVDRATRNAQSLTDKAESRIQKQVTERLKSVQEAYKLINGHEMPVEQRETVRQRVIAEVLSEDGSSDKGTSQPVAKPGEDELDPQTKADVEYVNRRTEELYEDYGFTLEESDPEASKLSFDAGPKEFLKTLKTAMDEKKTRLGSGQSGKPNVGQAGRIPSLGAGGQPTSIYEGRRGFDLLQEYYSKQGQ
jgi:hypothetical protein